jgi:hypothetical protein
VISRLRSRRFDAELQAAHAIGTSRKIAASFAPFDAVVSWVRSRDFDAEVRAARAIDAFRGIVDIRCTSWVRSRDFDVEFQKWTQD